ncbi:MAG: hypothetical protein U0165_05040 [Polyangiaceae bacterium]
MCCYFAASKLSRTRTSNSGSKEKVAPLAYRVLLAIAVPLVIGIFVLLNPHVRSEWNRAFADFEGIARHYREGHVKPFCEREPGFEHLFAAFGFVLTQSTHTNRIVATTLGLVALYGLFQLLRRPSPIAWLGVIHAVGVVFSMAWPNRAYLVRQYLTALPILCVGFGAGAIALWDQLGQRGLLKPRWLLPIAGVAAASVTAFQSVEAQRLSLDSRARAINYIASLHPDAPPRSISVALSTAVMGAYALGGHGELRHQIGKPSLRLVGELSNADAAEHTEARYIVVASHRAMSKIWPYEEQWAFKTVPGFHQIAQFEFSPYEHRLDLVPTWDGHVSAIVLERDSPSSQN